MRWVFRAALVLAITIGGAVSMEAVFRALDGWPWWGALPVANQIASADPAVRADRRHLAAIATAPGVTPAWYDENPATVPPAPVNAALLARATRYPSHVDVAFTVWNRSFLELQVCNGVRDYGLGALDDVYVFDPVEPGTLPLYRFLPSASPPGWFVTNRFGWRGPDVALNKDGRTIRIAFVGASTTIGRYSQPFSYPEYVGHWIDRWLHARHSSAAVDVINAARSGIDSFSIDAIVRQEVAPLEPDLVVYYEGANGFSPASVLRLPPGIARQPPRSTFRPPTGIERVSALARRLSGLLSRMAAFDGREPRKTAYPVEWPPDVDERSPDPDSPSLPLGLDRVVRNLDSMRAALAADGGTLAVASFVWLVPDRSVPLDMQRHLNIHTYLNRNLWPATYAHIRRMADFQNRVFRAYTQTRRMPYLDVAASFPQDPDLFDDPIHLSDDGVRLQAWIVFQQLVPWLAEQLDRGSLPRPMHRLRAHHPVLDAGQPGTVSLASVRSSCG